MFCFTGYPFFVKAFWIGFVGIVFVREVRVGVLFVISINLSYVITESPKILNFISIYHFHK